MPKKTGFTKLPHGFHKRIVDFKDGKSYTRLAVWLYHRCREGKDGTSYPGLRLIEEELDLKEDTVVQARRWLQDNGWLTKTGTVPSRDGQYAVPVMMTSIPSPLKGDGSRTRSKGMDRTRSTDDTVPFERVLDGTLSTGTEAVPSCEAVPTCEAAPVEASCLAGCLTEGISLDPFHQDLNKMFDTPASDAQVEAVISIIGENQDLWYWVRKLAASKSWQKYIHDPESLLFRMSINPKTGTSAFMSKCRAALEGQRRGDAARKRLRDEAEDGVRDASHESAWTPLAGKSLKSAEAGAKGSPDGAYEYWLLDGVWKGRKKPAYRRFVVDDI